MAHETQAGQRTEQRAPLPYLIHLIHDAKSLRAVTACHDHHLARAEDVGVKVVEMHAAAPGVGDRISDTFCICRVAVGKRDYVTTHKRPQQGGQHAAAAPSLTSWTAELDAEVRTA